MRYIIVIIVALMWSGVGWAEELNNDDMARLSNLKSYQFNYPKVELKMMETHRGLWRKWGWTEERFNLFDWVIRGRLNAYEKNYERSAYYFGEALGKTLNPRHIKEIIFCLSRVLSHTDKYLNAINLDKMLDEKKLKELNMYEEGAKWQH